MLDELLPPTLGEALQDVRVVAELGEAFAQARRRRNDERAGVIELEEVSPGVFAAPRRPNPPARRTNLGRFADLIGDFDHIARGMRGRSR